MSQLKVNTLRHTGASSDAITLAADGTAAIGECTAKITNNLSNRNLIINGAMQVAQRGTSSTTNGYGTVDRFQQGYSGHDEVLTQAQIDLTSSDTGPWAKGFRKAIQITNGNQTSGANAADYGYIGYVVEAQDLANSGWDYTSASSYITLSFWVKSSTAGNRYLHIYNFDGTAQGYSFLIGNLSANTWTKVTHSIPGNSNLQFDNNNSHGIWIDFGPFYGTNYTTSGHTVNQWAAYSSASRMPDNETTWWTTNDATYALTGVQLEVGDVATDFEHRSYGDELLRCQRYCYADRGSDDYHAVAQGHYNGTTAAIFMIFTPVAMRAAPTVSTPTGTWIASGDAGGLSTSNITGSDNVAETNAFQIRATVSGAESGEGFLFRSSSAGHSFILNSEL